MADRNGAPRAHSAIDVPSIPDPRGGPPRRAGARWLVTVLALATAGTVAWACGEQESEATGDDPTALELRRLTAALRRQQDRVESFGSGARSQRGNLASHRETLTKARRVFDGLAVATRIPDEADETSIRELLERAARQSHLRLGEFTVATTPRSERELPEAIVMPGRLDLREDDFREVLALRFSLSPPDISRLEAFRSAVIGEEPQRLVLIRQARATPRSFELEAEAYRFVPLRLPRYVLEAPREEAMLAEPRIAASLERFRERPEVRAELSALHQAIEAARREIRPAEEALVPLPEAELWVARSDFLERKAREMEELTVVRILQ